MTTDTVIHAIALVFYVIVGVELVAITAIGALRLIRKTWAWAWRDEDEDGRS